MANVRGTMFFFDHNSFVPAGWSETHWLQTADQPLPTAIQALYALAQVRMGLLASGISISYLRVSNDSIFRDSQIRLGVPALAGLAALPGGFPITTPGPPSGGGGQVAQPVNPAQAGDPADMPWTAVLVRGEGGTPFTARSMFWLPGLPDGITWSAQAGITDPNWVAAFVAYKNALVASWGFVGQDNSAGNPFHAIQNAVIVLGSNVVITCNSHGFVSGQMVRIKGVKTIGNLGKAVNAIWQIQVTDTSTFSLLGSATTPAFTYLSGGTAQLRSRVIIPYANLLQRRFGSRKKGRPFGLLTGRRRVKH
jgi:hypothetical protein